MDHCHYTGKYRGAAHSKCNLVFQVQKYFPVFFHNLTGYDSHLFIKNLGVTESNIKSIPNNEEKYISFSKEIVVGKYIDKKDDKEKESKLEIRFLDSFKFMSTSLETLAANLPIESFKNLTAHYEGEKFELMSRKGFFPYDWFDYFEKLNATQLPPKEVFYSKLTDDDISDDDCTHSHKFLDVFDMKTMRDYHDQYVKSDVLLLADVFENFRDVYMKTNGLDPVWYYTLPGLALDAMLKSTEAKLELLTDHDMHLMVEDQRRCLHDHYSLQQS